MPSTLTALLLLLLLNCCGLSVGSKPAADDWTVDRRLDLCARRSQVYSGALPIEKALHGLELSIASILWSDPFMRYDKVNKKYEGFHYDMITDLAKRGGFNFTYYLPPMAKGATWSDWLFETVDKFDLNGVYWIDTPPRAAHGVMTVYGIVDISTYLYAKMPDAKEKTFWEQTLSFMNPFTLEVWYVFWGVTVATGFAYFIFEHGHNDSDVPGEGGLGRLGGMANTLFLSQLQTSGAGGFAPQTAAGKILLMGWAWVILLFMAAYTGSMASVLVNQNKPKTSFQNLRQYIEMDKPLCAWGAPAEYVKQNYPSFAAKDGRLITKGNPMTNLAEGICEAAFDTKISIDASHNAKKLNPHCRHQIVGPPVTVGKGGWMSGGMRFDKKCTSLLKDAIAMLFIGMEHEGAVSKHYSNMIAYTADRTPSCDGGVDEGKEDELMQISLPEMSGIFYVHFFLAMVASVVFCCGKWGHAVYQITHNKRRAQSMFVPDFLKNGNGTGKEMDHQIDPQDHSNSAVMAEIRCIHADLAELTHRQEKQLPEIMEELSLLRSCVELNQTGGLRTAGAQGESNAPAPRRFEYV